MKSKFGIVFMIFGVLLIMASAALLMKNRAETQAASDSVELLLPQIQAAIDENMIKESQTPTVPVQTDDGVSLPEPEKTELPVVDIDGYGYIGYLSFPSLNMSLPVMDTWSYPQLKISPCRYSGSPFDNNLVIMAHNYERHFGNIDKLDIGDRITFTDMDGDSIYYEVLAIEVLMPTAVEEVTNGDYDLTLFTCTYSGKTRVTVRANQVEY